MLDLWPLAQVCIIRVLCAREWYSEQSTLLAWSTITPAEKVREVSENKWKNNNHESEIDSSDMSEADEVETTSEKEAGLRSLYAWGYTH